MSRSGKEFEVLEKIRGWVGGPSAGVLTGIGDDCAVLEPTRGRMLATVDMLVEGVHFDRGYCEPEEIGHKLLAVNLSDIAAMAGTPRFALVSLALSAGTDERFIERLYAGMRPLATKYGVAIVGGNISTSPGKLALDLCLLGEAANPIGRGGAAVGDVVAVTGSLGAAAAGFAALRKWGRGGVARYPAATKAQLTPEPRIAEGLAAAAAGATALIDVSDGLSSELHHLARASGKGILIEQGKLPVSEETKRIAGVLTKDLDAWVLDGGEDYELLATFPAGVALPAGFRAIGKVVEGSEVEMMATAGMKQTIAAGGWRHL